MTAPVVGVIMGSDSDWSVMSAAATALTEFEVPFEAHVVSVEQRPRVGCEGVDLNKKRLWHGGSLRSGFETWRSAGTAPSTWAPDRLGDRRVCGSGPPSRIGA